MVRKVWGASCVLVMLAVAVALVPQRGRASDIDNVRVVNGSRQPVPVSLAAGASIAVAGTPNVNVTGLPAVQLAGGTNVGINGTPNVNVANTPTVNVANMPTVTLNTSPASPLFALNVLDPATHAFQAAVHIPNGNGAKEIAIPAGTRFAIQTYDVRMLGPAAQGYPGLNLETQLKGASSVIHVLETHQILAPAGFVAFEGTGQVALYSDVNVFAGFSNGSSTADADLQLSGYVIPLP